MIIIAFIALLGLAVTVGFVALFVVALVLLLRALIRGVARAFGHTDRSTPVLLALDQSVPDSDHIVDDRLAEGTLTDEEFSAIIAREWPAP